MAQAESGVRDFIRTGANGLLADGDPDMVRALVTLVEDPALRRRMAIYNQSTASPHDWSHVLQQCDQLYQLAASRVGARACPAPGADRGTLPYRAPAALQEAAAS